MGGEAPPMRRTCVEVSASLLYVCFESVEKTLCSETTIGDVWERLSAACERSITVMRGATSIGQLIYMALRYKSDQKGRP
jgi:hypothetical protein